MGFRTGLLMLAFLVITPSPQRQREPAERPVLLISEVLYNAPGPDNQEEWVEIANLGTVAVDISRYKIGDEESAGGGEGMSRFPVGAVIDPGKVVVVAQTAVGFHRITGRLPDYEWQDTNSHVPDMRRFTLWSDGDIALANEGDELLLLDEKGRLVDALNYGSSVVYFNPSINLVPAGNSIARHPGACDSDSAAEWQAQPQPTPGTLPAGGTCPQRKELSLPPIGFIQGAGPIAPLVDEQVMFRGVVTSMMADQNAAGTIYHTVFVQDRSGDEDGDSATADGIALFAGRQRPALRIGDQIHVEGRVTEYHGLTEIDDAGLQITVERRDQTLPEPVPITLPLPGDPGEAEFERWEGMRVTLPGPSVVVGATYAGCGFAVMSGTDWQVRPWRRLASDPTDQVLPVLHTTDVHCAGFPIVKAGDILTDMVGVLTYHFDQFKLILEPVSPQQIAAAPLSSIPEPPALTGGTLAIVSFNMENHFDEIDDTGSAAEPKPTRAEIDRRQQKFTYAIGTMLGCPAIIGVQEVENAGLLRDLAGLLVEPCGFRYQVTHRESADMRGIDVALLTHPLVVNVKGAALRQGCTQLDTGIVDETSRCPRGAWPLFSRPPLQVDLHVNGRSLTILVNHFKSKRGGEAETAARRLAQADHINGLVSTMLTADPHAAIIVMGDFNDYEQSPAMQLLSTHLTNVLAELPASTRYTFVFSGVAQMLDGIFISSALNASVRAVMVYHVNADFPAAWQLDTSPSHMPYRATDHDVPLVVLALPGETMPQFMAPPVNATATPAADSSEQAAAASRVWPGWMIIGVTLVLVLVGWLDHRLPGK